MEGVKEKVKKKVMAMVIEKVRNIKLQKKIPLSFGEVSVRQNEHKF